MRSSAVKPQVVGFLLLGVIVLFALFKAFRFEFTRPGDGAVAHHYSIRLLAQYAAEPGKTIHITRSGLPPVEYVCSTLDAAVGVVQVADSAHGLKRTTDPIPLNCGPAVDSEGHHYEVSALGGQGNIYFVKIARGFAIAPNSIQVWLFVGQVRQIPSPWSVKLAQIAPPTRVVSPPSRTESVAADRIALAETVGGRSTVYVRVVHKQSPSETYNTKVLATSFCPGPSDGQGSYEPDAVEVQIDAKKRETHEMVLTYRNAKVAQIGGNRMLVLPSDQVVGTLGGCQIIARRVDPVEYNIHSLSHSLAVVNLVLSASGKAPSGQFVRCLSVSPSPEALGLSYMQIVMATMGSSQTIAAGHAQPANLISEIPELKLWCEVEQWDRVSSRTLRLAVRHVANDPALGLFRAVPPAMGVGGPGVGPAGFGGTPLPPHPGFLPPPMRRGPDGVKSRVPFQTTGK